MKPTDTPHTPDGSIPTPGNYPLYEYPAYTFDKKYENDEFQKKVITLDSAITWFWLLRDAARRISLPKGWFVPSHAVCRWMTCSA